MSSWNLRDLGFLAIRALAVFAFILGIQRLIHIIENAIPYYMGYLAPPDNVIVIGFVAAIPALLLIIVSILLWVFAHKLSFKMVPSRETQTGEGGIPEHVKAWESFFLSVAGLILLVISIGRMAYILAQYLHMETALPDFVYFERKEYLYSLAEYVVYFILGLLLILKADGLAHLLRSIRRLGHRRAEAADQQSE